MEELAKEKKNAETKKVVKNGKEQMEDSIILKLQNKKKLCSKSINKTFLHFSSFCFFAFFFVQCFIPIPFSVIFLLHRC